jgi:hypothetical protein
VRLLCAEVGWRLPDAIPHENRSVRVQSKDSIDPETLAYLQEHNQLDFRLYEYAKSLFVERLRRAKEAQSNGPELKPIASTERDPQLPIPNRFVPFPTPESVGRVGHVVSVSAQPAVENGENYFTITYQVSELIPELIVGVLVHDSEGNVVGGTNTMHQKIDVPQEVDRPTQVALKFFNKLAPGTYSVSAALARGDRPGFHCDWVDRALLFRIEAPRTVESRVEKFARQAFRPISQRFFTRLQSVLQPIEGRLGMLQAVTHNVRDRVASMHDSIVALRAGQDALRTQVAELSRRQAGEHVHDSERTSQPCTSSSEEPVKS